MKKITEFLAKNPNVFLATCEQDQPRVRPFQFLFEVSGRLYFCTANTKEVYRQLMANPALEFAATSPEYVTLRVRGKAVFSDDLALKRRVLEEFEMIRGIYRTPDNPIFTLFYLSGGEAIFSDFSGNPPERRTF